jgi:uncharacterized protein (DUF1778 family)
MATELKQLKSPKQRAFLEVQSELRQANHSIEDTQVVDVKVQQLRALINHLNQASAAASRVLGMIQVNEA